MRDFMFISAFLYACGCTSPTISTEQFNEASEWASKANEKGRNGDYAGALADYNRAMALNPDLSASSYNNRAMCKISLGDKEGAIADWTTALRRDPKYVNALFQRGNALYELGKKTDALKDWDRTIELDANYQNAYWNRAKVRLETNDRTGACTDYRKLLGFGSPRLPEFDAACK